MAGKLALSQPRADQRVSDRGNRHLHRLPPGAAIHRSKTRRRQTGCISGLSLCRVSDCPVPTTLEQTHSAVMPMRASSIQGVLHSVMALDRRKAASCCCRTGPTRSNQPAISEMRLPRRRALSRRPSLLPPSRACQSPLPRCLRHSRSLLLARLMRQEKLIQRRRPPNRPAQGAFVAQLQLALWAHEVTQPHADRLSQCAPPTAGRLACCAG